MAAPKLRLVFVFGAFLGILRAPCRCVSLFWRGPLWEPFSWALSCFLALRPSSVAVPKLCQRLFLTGFRRPVFGPRPASFLVRFWAYISYLEYPSKAFTWAVAKRMALLAFSIASGSAAPGRSPLNKIFIMSLLNQMAAKI